MLNGIVGAFSVIFFKVYDPDEGKKGVDFIERISTPPFADLNLPSFDIIIKEIETNPEKQREHLILRRNLIMSTWNNLDTLELNLSKNFQM